MIQMYRADLPLSVPCAVSSDGVDTVILVNSNHLGGGGDTAPMREHVNCALRKLAEHDAPPLGATG